MAQRKSAAAGAHATADPAGMAAFRIRAPKAKAVALYGDWMARDAHQPLERTGNGEWCAAAGPLAPGPYLYTLVVDGAAAIPGFVEVPGDGTEYYASRRVPHGSLDRREYHSRTLGGRRSVVVYTPPGYGADAAARYPALYLLHGTGDTEETWISRGLAHQVLDNLLADGKARPMILVMPYGHAVDPRLRDPVSSARNVELFAQDLIEDVLPVVESVWRAEPAREQRAVAGLSLGGAQALHVGLGNLDKFAWIGVFSAGAGMRSNPAGDFEKRFAPVLWDAARVNQELRLLWIACGDADFHFPAARLLRGLLYKYGITNTFHKTGGGHTWRNWRQYLFEFAPLLFR